MIAAASAVALVGVDFDFDCATAALDLIFPLAAAGFAVDAGLTADAGLIAVAGLTALRRAAVIRELRAVAASVRARAGCWFCHKRGSPAQIRLLFTEL